MALMLGIVALTIFAVLYLLRLYHAATNRGCRSLKNLMGRTAIVTGGTSGMGLEIALDLARRGARVIIACPFPEEGINALKIIEEKTRKEAVFKLLDLGSLESVRKFADDILKNEDRLDLLMNNAGIGMPRNFETNDRLNYIMQVQYYGHFLLTLLLLPLLKKSGTATDPARVVNTSSRLHYLGRVDLSDSDINWISFFSYCNSKFSMILFSRELTRRLKGTHIVVHSIDPGTVGTGIYKCSGEVLGAICRYLLIFCSKTAQVGAQTALHVALDDEVGQTSGEYFENCGRARAISRAYNDKDARLLWEVSISLVKLTDEELERCFK